MLIVEALKRDYTNHANKDTDIGIVGPQNVERYRFSKTINV